jgi:ribonuclease Z
MRFVLLEAYPLLYVNHLKRLRLLFITHLNQLYSASSMVKFTFLGTSSMVPTKERNVSGICLEYDGEFMLIDCGEGTQRQMNMAGLNRNKVKKIFITHWHADHVAGIMGLIQTIGNKDNDIHLDIYGPKGSQEHFDHLLKASVFDQQLDIVVHEIDVGEEIKKIHDSKKYEIWAIMLNHSTPTLGYRFVEKDRRKMKLKELEKLGVPPGPLFSKLQRGYDVTCKGKKIKTDDVTTIVHGKKIAFVADTRFCQQAIELATDVDVVVAEATYSGHEEEKAHQFKHMTSQQSAQVASMAGAKKLYLTHFSQRYKSLNELHEEAKNVFPETFIANDLNTVKL